MSEFFAVVDENDRVIGKATRKECHLNRNLIHRSVYIFVVNSRNEVFLQKRSMSKDLYPGFFTASATGHVEYGEDYDGAAKRELDEELGIDAPLLRLGKVNSFTEDEREISMLYVCHFDGRITVNRKEIAKGGFFSIDKIEKSLRKGEKKFADGFRIAFAEFLNYMKMH
ncbi:MAG: NUDIX domain-containing protein [Candidatus Bathyarchaeia archaeon]|nr:NUDIX domain-containing protein [Candidatus Bathyarchaeota archaeon]